MSDCTHCELALGWEFEPGEWVLLRWLSKVKDVDHGLLDSVSYERS
jgi:hypothetical protein